MVSFCFTSLSSCFLRRMRERERETVMELKLRLNQQLSSQIKNKYDIFNFLISCFYHICIL